MLIGLKNKWQSKIWQMNKGKVVLSIQNCVIGIQVTQKF
jgi:hypothetical protein